MQLLRAYLVAPLPLFLCMVWIFYVPELGWRDAGLGALFSAALSYGVMLLAGLPTYFLLVKLERSSLLDYCLASMLVTALLIGIYAIIDITPPLIDPADGSPFAGATMADMWPLMLGLALPWAVSTAGLFWFLAVRTQSDAAA